MKRPAPIQDRIYVGDAEQVLRSWPSGFVDLCVTSPPYFQMRDYGHQAQLGLEETPEQYVDRLVAVLEQVGRVLKPGGSLYLNLGDTYRGKSLLGIPWRVAMELTKRGWYLRNAIVWNKPYGLPSAIKDRLTNHYEFVFHLTRSRRYFFNLDPVRIPNTSTRRRLTGPVRRGAQGLAHRPGLLVAGNFIPNPKGKNPGDVWTIGPESRPKEYIVPGQTTHFAPFPEELASRPILAASQPGGVVLDPFMGSGTTALVAARLGRHFLGVELVPSYAKLAAARLRHGAATDRKCSHRSFSSCSLRRTGKGRNHSARWADPALSFSDRMAEAA
jgi:DNA modification methylase